MNQLPCIDEYIDLVEEAVIFSTLNKNSGFGKVEVDKRDRKKNAFTGHYSLYQFLRIPFGLKNESIIFKRAIDLISSSVK